TQTIQPEFKKKSCAKRPSRHRRRSKIVVVAYGIGPRVDHPSQHRRELQERYEPLPRRGPRRDCLRILGAPRGGLELGQGRQRGLLVWGGVDFLELGGDLLAV